MGKEKVRFAIVGFGHVGNKHAEMINANPYAEIAAICDIKPKSELNLSAFSNIPYFNSIDELLASDTPFDVVNVCTPNGYHAEQSIKALEVKKHVVCEKPMSLTKKDCESIIYKALQVSRHVFCVMQNRYSPPALWLKEVIDNNLLGNIYLVQINCFWNRDNRYYKPGSWKGRKDLDGGILFTQFSHFIDMMYWLFGDIQNIHSRFNTFANGAYTEFEDTGFVSFDFVNGGMGTISFSTAVCNQNFESSITIIGEKGTVKVGGQYMNEVQYCSINDYTMPELAPCNPPNDYGPYKGSASNHQFVIQNVIDTIKGHASVTTNALEGLKVVDIIERIYQSGS